MVIVLGPIHIDAVQAVGVGLSRDGQVGGIDIHAILHAPESVLGDGNLCVRRAHTHGDSRSCSGIHIIAVKIHLKFMLAHTQRRQLVKLILSIIAIHHNFPDNTMGLTNGLSGHVT